ncbi:MAG: DUF1800 family protein [Fulvivirga sp.]
MPITPLTGTLGIKRAAHLLRRATFGGTKADIDTFAGLTAAEAVSRLFDTTIEDVPLPLDTETGQEWISTGAIEDVTSGDDELRDYFKRWFVGLMMGVGNTIDSQKLAYTTREKLTLFLHIHFTTMDEKVRNSRALYFQNVLFRLFSFDQDDRMVDITDEDTGDVTTEVAPTNFKELTKKICVDNAMLRFLDGNQNVQGSPNENYAREMFELYTIGRGLEARVNGMPPSGDGDYFTFTEQDVQAAARVLTGFKFDDTFGNIDQYTGLPRGTAEPGQHTTDSSAKTFSTYFDSVTIDQDPTLLDAGGNPTEESMLDEISQLIDMIFDREETARHICRKLYRFYVYYEIDEPLDDDIIANMAATLIANDYKIQPLLEELFQSEHFYEAVAGNQDDKFGGIIKSPLDLILNSLTFFDFQLPTYDTDLANFYDVTGSLLDQMSSMGMNFYEPFEVAGYVAYHQYPIYNRNWISTNYLTLRYNFIREIFNQNPQLPYDYVKDNFNAEAMDGKQLIVTLSSYLYPFAENLDFEADGGDLTKERVRYFLQTFLQFTDYSDTAMVTQANDDWVSLYTDDANYLEAGEYLRRLFNSMLQSPEYQLF